MLCNNCGEAYDSLTDEGLCVECYSDEKVFFSYQKTEVREKFLDLVCRLSPENLSCDGELSKSEIRRKYKKLMAEWQKLEKRIGRKVSESIVWDRECAGDNHNKKESHTVDIPVSNRINKNNKSERKGGKMKSKTKEVCPECGCDNVELTGGGKMLTAVAGAGLGGAGGLFAGQAGASSGMALGAGLGSVLPGIGTAIGAVTGGLIGSIAGVLTGAGVGSIAGKELERRMGVFKCNECGMIFKS